MLKLLSSILLLMTIFVSIGWADSCKLDECKADTATQKIEFCSFCNLCNNITITSPAEKINLSTKEVIPTNHYCENKLFTKSWAASIFRPPIKFII